MKAKYLFYATLVALISCSQEDFIENGVNDDKKAEGTTLVLKVQDSSIAGTKAVVPGKPGDQLTDIGTIGYLTALVFSEDGKLEGTSTYQGTHNVWVAGLTPGPKKVIALANVGEMVKIGNDPTEPFYENKSFTIGMTYEGVLAKTKDFLGEKGLGKETELVVKEGALSSYRYDVSMCSQVYDVVLQRGVDNYLGEESREDVDEWGGKWLNATNSDPDAGTADKKGNPVWLYRNVARVHLKEINVKEAEGDVMFKNPELHVTGIFILNAKNESAIIGESAKAWGKTYLADEEDAKYINGPSNYDGWYKWYFDNAKDVACFKPYLKEPVAKENYVSSSYLYSGYEDESSENKVGNGPFLTFPANNGPYSNPNGWLAGEHFLIYENLNIEKPTLLVVMGNFYYTDPSGNRQVWQNRFYPVRIGIDGLDEKAWDAIKSKYPVASRTEDELKGVLRNINYEITMTITGPGSRYPHGMDEQSWLSVYAKIVPFEKLSQDVKF